MKQRIQVGIGTRFSYTYADSKPLWEVKSARGRGTWNCEVVESPDWLGTKKVFGSEEIAGSIGMSNLWAKLGKDSDDYYNTLAPGQIVHYDNGFNNFVRCEVTNDRQLLAIALVGKWSDIDLPKRQLNGTIYLPYHAEKISKGKETFHPHSGCIWEAKAAAGTLTARDIDPRLLVPISLTVPPMTEEQEAVAVEYRKLDAIRALLQDNGIKPKTAFDKIKSIIG